MTKASLYINPQGYAVTRHSYSGSQTFQYCARKYQLERLAGWKERKQSAAAEFGKVLENAITEFHKNGAKAALEMFHAQWNVFKENKELDYSKKHVDWQNLDIVGIEFIKLYAVKYPQMPFVVRDPNNDFQVQRTYEVFPDTELAGIELTSYIDIIAEMKNGHFDPMADDNRAVLDMKVSTSSCPELVALDPQLRTYSWTTGISTCGFLWFKINSRDFSAGDELTSLVTGKTVIMLSKDINDIPLTPPSVFVTADKKIFESFDAMPGRSAADKKAKIDFIKENGLPVASRDLTAQAITVSTALITKESSNDMRRQIEQDIIRIHAANEDDFWPQQSGVRWPNDKCVTCPMRGICSGNDKLRDEILVRDIKSAPAF